MCADTMADIWCAQSKVHNNFNIVLFSIDKYFSFFSNEGRK